MPSLVRNLYAARVKTDGISEFLGYFTTYEEALQIENDHRIAIGKTPRPLQTTPVVKTYLARRYRNGNYLSLGRFPTPEAARAAEAAFDAKNPRQKPGPNKNPKKPAHKRKNYYQ